MKSSSRLFPVQLIRAEVTGSLAEDVYLIKPQNSPDKSVQIAVTHLTSLRPPSSSHDGERRRTRPTNKANKTPIKPALVLLHGCYQNRRLWFSQSCCDLVDVLIDQGFDVWLMEQRGHGLSPQNECFASNVLEDYARYDIPAVNAFIREKTATKPSWVGYGEGAGALLLSLACGSLKKEAVTHITGIGSPFGPGSLAKSPGSYWIARALKLLPHKNARYGPEQENPLLVRRLIRDGVWPRYRGQAMGFNLWSKLESLQLPLYWLSANAELGRLDPGLQQLQQSHFLEASEVPLKIEHLLPEQIQDTLSDKTKIKVLMDSVSVSVNSIWESDKFLSVSPN